jgi:hypothetical protein
MFEEALLFPLKGLKLKVVRVAICKFFYCDFFFDDGANISSDIA